MLDIKLLRENTELVKQNIAKKGENEKFVLVDEILDLDGQWRKIKYEIDQLKAERNKLSQQINEAKKAGADIKPILVKAKELPKKIIDLEERADNFKIKINKKFSKIPNIMHPLVPKGKDESKNVEIKKVGEIKEKDFRVLNHVELCEKNNWADFEASAETSGNGFYYLMGDLALLNQALIQFAINFLQQKGYTYIEGPLMLKKKIIAGAVDAEAFEESIYKIEGEDLNLIATSEHNILGLLTNKVIPEENLPLKLFSYSMSFRKEIGSHGINEKGLWRTHQFNKVEQFIFAKPEETWEAFAELLKNSEEMMQELNLPYRIIEMCTGDLSLWKSRAFDVEIYRPTTKSYGELLSLSNCTDFQSRDLNIKLLRKNNEREIVHALNNTGIATSRMMVAVLENYQNKEGTVDVPEALIPYMFGKKKLEPCKKVY
jgi:seryl-tRNA synthetase